MNKKQIKQKAENCLSFLDGVSRSYDYRSVYCVNVKRYNDYIDVLDIANAYPKKVKEAIVEHFTDEYMGSLYQDWLEYEGRYFIEDFMNGCTINSKQHYQELRETVLLGKATCYPYIERKRSEKAKLALIEQWNKKDREIERHLSLLDIKTAGLYGRSGGWFGVRSSVEDNLNALLYDIDNGYTLSEIDATHDYIAYFNEVKAIAWILSEAENFNKGLSWEEELKYRVSEYVEEVEVELQKEKEVKTARSLAEKHGYLLAQAV